MQEAKITLAGSEHSVSLVTGSEGEVGLDISKFRASTKAVMLDPGYGNTGSCQSAITFINGEEGILRHRGYAIEDLAENICFEEMMYLLIWGELPTSAELDSFRSKLIEHSSLPSQIGQQFDALPQNIHPMASLSSIVTTLSAHYPTGPDRDVDIIRLLAKFKALVACGYRRATGQEFIAPEPGSTRSYVGDFLHMMYGEVDPVVEKALDKILILHADHEQNCSASTVRMVGSSQANLYATISAGISALSGPLHGGANQKVIEMLEEIIGAGGDVQAFVEKSKDKSSGFKLMGFGHRVYKNFDPRARIIQKSATEVLDGMGVDDPALDVARALEVAAREDSFFVNRRLYPNVDFYSGIVYRALGVPTDMFTAMFALGRLPGWIAQWKELRDDPTSRIHRPRQVYVGENVRAVPSLSDR